MRQSACSTAELDHRRTSWLNEVGKKGDMGLVLREPQESSQRWRRSWIML